MRKSSKKIPIRDRIYSEIKSDIMNGTYAPGSRLSITSISRAMKVSNSPVREAISMLNRDGLVDIFPNSGPLVIKLSDKKLSDIAQAILSMLLGAFEICQQTERIDYLIELLGKALNAQIHHPQDSTVQEYVRCSIAFEKAFITCCDNPYITRQYTAIEDLFYLVVLYNQQRIETGRSHTIMEHQQILSAITGGDHSAAKMLISRHYNRFRNPESPEGR